MRTPARRAKPRTSQMVSFPAPVGGWVANQNIAKPIPGAPQGAEMLVNWFPTATGAELRDGSEKYATLGAGNMDVKSFMLYKNGSTSKIFAAIDTAIYDISVIADPNVSPSPAVPGTANGMWNSAQFTNTGAVYLVAVNGDDTMRVYDGSFWYPISDQNLSTLNYDAQTANFTVGATITGATSTAHGVLVAQQDNGSTGFLVLSGVVGTFQDNEIISGGGGSAAANGTQATSFIGISGVATSDLIFPWAFKNRLFFIEKESMNVWYMPVDQLGGTALVFPLGGVFSLGGSLMFGATWSINAGNGLQDNCIFVTTEGQVAVYQGTNPSIAADWSLVGVYRIGRPLGPNAWFRAGGDIVIDTDIGMVPLSQAINRDIAVLSPSSVSYSIETAWNESVSLRRSEYWHSVVWPERQMVVTALPTVNNLPAKMYATNARTGAWCEFSGWDGKCLAVYDGRMFFGSDSGRVVEAYVTGMDQGTPYSGIYVPLYVDLKTPASIKIPRLARPVMRSTRSVDVAVSVQYDYVTSLPPPPAATPVTTGSEWGVGIWGTSIWGEGGQKQIQQDWLNVAGQGYAVAPALQITSGSVVPLQTEIVRIDMTYETGDIVS